MARDAEDYGVPDFSDEVLTELAGNQKKYGEKGKFAARELATRGGRKRDTAEYQRAAERAAYQQLSPQFTQGLARINSTLAGSGPLADSGAGTALRANLGGQIYGQAAGQVGGGVRDLIGDFLRQRQQFRYQQILQKQQQKAQQTGIGGVLGGVAGAFGGPLLGAAGKALGEKVF